MKPSARLLILLGGATAPFSCVAQNLPSATALPLRAGTLLQTDFEGGVAWKTAPSAVGTIDVAGSTQPSLGLQSSSTISSGPLPVRSSETNLGKLTLAFSLSTSAGRLVVVRVESLDKNQKRSGGLETRIYPAAPNFYQRYALDLSTFTPVGAGKFQPNAPFVSFSFAVSGPDWAGVPKPEIRLDNVHYAKPAWYVSAGGNDQNDGRSEKTAFARPQKALDLAGPGDIIVVMEGTYAPNGTQGGVATFLRPGSPAGWISLKNYPGQKPTFSAVGTWNTVRIGSVSKEDAFNSGPALAYLEVRGLHVRGDSDGAKAKYADLIGKPDPHTNGNGISVEGRTTVNKPHHIRFADNLVEQCAGGGISLINTDWSSVENNVVRNNCWWMIYAGSGISFLEGQDFDGTDNVYRSLIRGNIVSGNRCYQPWAKIGKMSDGNGIIVDSNKIHNFKGRTLVQNNLSFNNGGSGIHSFSSRRVDIINNTAYYNGATPELRWGQIFLQRTDDARMLNNILVSRDDQPVNVVSTNSDDKQNSAIVRAHNLYFGGNTPPLMGEGDKIADPQFVRPNTDVAVANFRLKPTSPALGAGIPDDALPFLDLDGKKRGQAPTIGAYQQ